MVFSRSEFRGLSAIFVAIGEVTFGFALAGITVLSLDVSKLLVIVLEMGYVIQRMEKKADLPQKWF